MRGSDPPQVHTAVWNQVAQGRGQAAPWATRPSEEAHSRQRSGWCGWNQGGASRDAGWTVGHRQACQHQWARSHGASSAWTTSAQPAPAVGPRWPGCFCTSRVCLRYVGCEEADSHKNTGAPGPPGPGGEGCSSRAGSERGWGRVPHAGRWAVPPSQSACTEPLGLQMCRAERVYVWEQ